MSSRLTPIGPERLPEVLAFLRDAYGLSADAPGFTPQLAAWKTFAPHPWWRDGSRGYVLESGGEITAYGCISPFRFRGPDGLVECAQVLDWAGARRSPGAGLLLYSECLNHASTLIAPGGSDDTRKLVARSRLFRKVTEEHLFARPLHPFRALRDKADSGWRRALRTARRLL